MKAKTVILFAYFVSTFLVIGQGIDPVEGYRGKKTIPSEYGLAIHNLRHSLSMYSSQNDGQISQK